MFDGSERQSAVEKKTNPQTDGVRRRWPRVATEAVMCAEALVRLTSGEIRPTGGSCEAVPEHTLREVHQIWGGSGSGAVGERSKVDCEL